MSNFTEHTQLTKTEDLPILNIPSNTTENLQCMEVDPKDSFKIPKNAKALLVISEGIDTVLFLNQ